MFFFGLIIFSLLGLVVGSFSTFLIYRISYDLPWLPWQKARGKEKVVPVSSSRSFCPHCKHTLSVRDLFPVLSYLCLKGRCRQCAESISPMYLWVELTCLAGAILIYAFAGMSAYSFFLLVALPFLVALSVIDLRYMILPDNLNIVVGLIGGTLLMYSLATGILPVKTIVFSHVGGGLFFSLFIWGVSAVLSRVLKKDSLGFGDVKFFAVAGLWLGFFNFPLFCLLSGVYGIALGLVWKLLKGNDIFPFGPAIIFAFFTVSLLRPLNAYLLF